MHLRPGHVAEAPTPDVCAGRSQGREPTPKQTLIVVCGSPSKCQEPIDVWATCSAVAEQTTPM